MKRYVSLFFILFGISMVIEAQQLPQFTQFQLNNFILNPAVAGSNPYFEAKSNNRYQWEGITDAPRTLTLSLDGPLTYQKMGIGGYIFVDITGPTKRTGFSLAYSYHIQLADDIHLSLAANAGIMQYSLDGSEITLENPDDAIFYNRLESKLLPEAGFSFYLYGSNFYFGGSVPELIRNKISFKNTEVSGKGRIENHFYLMAGYKFIINESFKIEPSALFKYVKPVPSQFELSLKGTYKDIFWAGLSYRQKDAIALLAGFTLNQTFSLGYSYDFIQSSIAKYSTGSHELMIAIKFNKGQDQAEKDKEKK